MNLPACAESGLPERLRSAETETTLYFGPWYRQSPFFAATLRAGCTAFDIYNHMCLPAYYSDPETEYQALTEGVTLWDVSVERTIQVSGPDADRLIDMLTCRDLTRCAVGQCKYMLVTAPSGGIVNDPVLLHVAENEWWMQLADSDADLYALGVLSQTELEAEILYPDVHPVQLQGPLAAATLAKLAGERLLDLRYYWCDRFELGDIPVVVSRTGWSAVPGFEINLLDASRADELWDAILGAGEEFSIRVIAPSQARRIEAGIFNYGSDITLADTPFHVMGLERLVEEQPQDYIGKQALEDLRRRGVDRKLVGIELSGPEPIGPLTRAWPALRNGSRVGEVTDTAWSPRLAKTIGYVRVPIELAAPGNRLEVESEHGPLSGVTASIPFVDPAKRVPAAPLRSLAH